MEGTGVWFGGYRPIMQQIILRKRRIRKKKKYIRIIVAKTFTLS